MEYHTEGNNKTYYIDEDFAVIGAGREGKVYKIDDNLAAKILRDDVSDDLRRLKARKVTLMINLGKGQDISYLAWPKEKLYDENDRFVGFTMPHINGDMLGRISIDPNLSWRKKIFLAKKLSQAVCEFHEMGHIIGSGLNFYDVMYDDNNGHLTLIDCDSFQIAIDDKTAYPSGVRGDDEYVAPEQQKHHKDKFCVYTKESDDFTLAIIIYQLLSSGFHPFMAHYTRDDGGETKYNRKNNINNGICPICPETCKDPVTGKDLPVGIIKHFSVYPNEIFPPNICELFRKTFVESYIVSDKGIRIAPKNRATAKEWFNALSDVINNLKKCDKNQMHYYHNDFEKCPLCLNEERKTEGDLNEMSHKRQ